jgi:hypothetical protein
MAVTIVGAKAAGQYLDVTVQGAGVEELTSLAAQRIAFDERTKHGFESAGISSVGHPYPINLKDPDREINDMSEFTKDRSNLAYRNVFRLMRGV